MFRDEDDRTVVTFSPYHDISSDVAGEIFLPGYDVEISNLSIYGVYYGKNVPLFQRNGYRKSGAMIP